jgi:hypothetical protein
MTDEEQEAELPPRPEAAYPLVASRASDEQLAAARHFVDVVARVDSHGDAVRHLCVLLGDAMYHRNPYQYGRRFGGKK